MEILILISVFTRIPQKKLNSPPRSAILRDFQNQNYRFQNVLDAAGRKTRRTAQAIGKRYAFHANRIIIRKDNKEKLQS